MLGGVSTEYSQISQDGHHESAVKVSSFFHAQLSQVKRNALIDCTNTCQYV